MYSSAFRISLISKLKMLVEAESRRERLSADVKSSLRNNDSCQAVHLALYSLGSSPVSEFRVFKAAIDGEIELFHPRQPRNAIGL